MTIAAGFLCKDGILLCADNEHTDELGKVRKDKIFKFEDNLICTGAGTSAYVKMAFDKLCESYRRKRPQNPEDARAAAEEVITSVFLKNITPFHELTLQPPDVALITATRCDNGELALVIGEQTATQLADSYAMVGTGKYLFQYWTEYFYRSSITMDLMAYWCLFMLRESKEHAYGCGGQSQVARLPYEVPDVVSGTVYDDSKLLAGFPRSALIPIIMSRDLQYSESIVELLLQQFSDGVRAIREESKRDAQGIQAMKEASFGRLAKPSDAQTSEDRQ